MNEYGHFTGSAKTITVAVEAGKTYGAWPEVTHLATKQGAVVPLEERLKGHDVKWNIVIRQE